MATPGKRYEFNVQMACPGITPQSFKVYHHRLFRCGRTGTEEASKYIPPETLNLTCLDISKLDVSLKEQSVKVDTTLPFEQVQQAIKKTGKTVTSGRVVGDAPAPAVAKANVPKPAVVA